MIETSARPAATADYQPTHKLVLILDDDPSTPTFISDIVTHELNSDAVAFTDPHTALHLLQQKLPDLIVLGVLMPAMNSLHFYKSLRADSTTKATPVLFVNNLPTIPGPESPGVHQKLAFVSKPVK